MHALRRLLQRMVPAGARRELRRRWWALRPPHITAGVGQGLRFDPGPSNPAYGTGDNEIPVQEALAAHLRAGGVLFDIGANVGFFTVLGARLVGPSGRVIAFEPVPANAAMVRRNIALNGFDNVEVAERAVADEEGPTTLVLAEYSGGAALSSAAPPPDAAGSIDVEVVTIDGVIERSDQPAPSVVKIDVEGAELAVLRGMTKTLDRARPIVICEVDDATSEGYRRKYDECVSYLSDRSYRITPLEESYRGNDWIVGHFVASPASTEDE